MDSAWAMFFLYLQKMTHIYSRAHVMHYGVDVYALRVLPLIKTNFDVCPHVSARAYMIDAFFFFQPGMTPYHLPFCE